VRWAKRWTEDDQRVLDEACRTGLLPDGRPASQNRLALYLNFSREWIRQKLDGRQLPMHYRAMQDGARNSAYVRAVRRAVTMLQQSKKVRRVRP
jgi:hypothetical protein